MDGWLKGLVAATCVVVIAGGGYYAWSEYSAKEERRLIGERQAASSECRSLIAEISNGRMQVGDALDVQRCATNGFVSASDIKQAYERGKQARQ